MNSNHGGFAPKGNFECRLEANKALGTEPLAVASGIKTQAEI